MYFGTSLLFEIQSKNIKNPSRPNWEAENEHKMDTTLIENRKTNNQHQQNTLPSKSPWPLWAWRPPVLQLLWASPAHQRLVSQVRTLHPETEKWGHIDCVVFSEEVTRFWHGSSTAGFCKEQCYYLRCLTDPFLSGELHEWLSHVAAD